MIDFIVQNNDIRDEGATILANAISSGVALRRLELLVCLLPYAAPNDTRTYSLTRTRRFVCFVVTRSTMESASLELRASRRRSATRSSSTFRLVLWYAALAHTLRSRDLIRVHDSSADVNVLRVVHGALGARGSTVGYCSSLVVSLSLSLSNDSSCCTKWRSSYLFDSYGWIHTLAEPWVAR